VDISGLKEGFYMVVMTGEGIQSFTRLVINR